MVVGPACIDTLVGPMNLDASVNLTDSDMPVGPASSGIGELQWASWTIVHWQALMGLVAFVRRILMMFMPQFFDMPLDS